MTPRHLILLVLLAAAWPARAASVPPDGAWLTDQGGGVIRLGPCGDRLCGWVSGLSFHDDGTPPQMYSGGTQCGFNLIRGMTRTEPNLWEGIIVNPEDGKQYRSRLWIGDGGELRLRGYIGLPILGRTTVWTRYAGRTTADCHMTP